MAYSRLQNRLPIMRSAHPNHWMGCSEMLAKQVGLVTSRMGILQAARDCNRGWLL